MKLVHSNHPALRTVSQDVPRGENVNPLICVMWSIIERGGIGLAANQVGELKRVIVVDTNGYRQAFINPVITKRYGGRVTSREDCLSFPGKTAKKIRYKRIIVEGFTPDWEPITRKLKGIAAICVQHEVDHLNGVTI